MTIASTPLDQLCINTIRTLSMDGVQKAKSGHPGMPMGAAAMAYILWTRHLKHNPHNPDWNNRDRFVLSAGHGSMLLYSLLHLTGYDLPLEELKSFRQWGSKTPGHPEAFHTPGVEVTTGPLGQGFATGVGMAIAEKHLAARYNKPNNDVINYRIYAIVSDGDLQEGIASEAASLAAHLKLGNIIYLYDDNHISIDGPTSLSFSEDVALRFEAYGWHVQTVSDGNDLAAIDIAIKAAQEETQRPSLIKVRTHIGYGSPNKQDTSEAHGAPLGDEEVRLTKKNLGLDPQQQFHIPDEALTHFRRAVEMGKKWESLWQTKFENYRKMHPESAQELEKIFSGNPGEEWKKALPLFGAETGSAATREASGKVLNAIAPHLPSLIGGSADLTPSNNTAIKGFSDFQPGSYSGRYIRFGVREHAMGAILNGLALSKGLIPYGGTFFVFSDYLRPTIRLAALMKIRPIYVFTHDSIGVGEDGPTHQPIEHLAALRCIPNMTVIRPADANETAQAWRVAIEHRDGPVALILTRQKLPVFIQTEYGTADNLEKGAYTLWEQTPTPEVLLLASGSEVHLALNAAKQLAEAKISVRVVSMPSWELFERQPKEYRDSILPPSVKKRVAIEAAVPMGWEKYSGDAGTIIGIPKFGASGPAEKVFSEYGITVENILKHVRDLL